MRRLAPLVSFALLAGCESGLSVHATLEVADAAADAFTPEAPGLLRLDAAGFVVNVAPACGERFEPRTVYVDHGFGCVREKDADARLLAWIEPAPADWDLAALCALAPEETDSLDLTAVGDTTLLAAAPDPAWAQGETTVPWERDLSPCGGFAEGTVAVR